MARVFLGVLLVAALAGCAAPSADRQTRASEPPGESSSTVADESGSEESLSRRERGLDPTAQKALVERMKACCGTAK